MLMLNNKQNKNKQSVTNLRNFDVLKPSQIYTEHLHTAVSLQTLHCSLQYSAQVAATQTDVQTCRRTQNKLK